MHLRLNEATQACIKRADLAQMKTDALFVNTSRSELIEKNALYEALMLGRPGAGAVFEMNPRVKKVSLY